MDAVVGRLFVPRGANNNWDLIIMVFNIDNDYNRRHVQCTLTHNHRQIKDIGPHSAVCGLSFTTSYQHYLCLLD